MTTNQPLRCLDCDTPVIPQDTREPSYACPRCRSIFGPNLPAALRDAELGIYDDDDDAFAYEGDEAVLWRA
jgi:hypothetical protein